MVQLKEVNEQLSSNSDMDVLFSFLKENKEDMILLALTMLDDIEGWSYSPQFYISFADDCEDLFSEEDMEYLLSKTPPNNNVRDDCYNLIYKAHRIINLKDCITVVDYDKKCIFTGKDYSNTHHYDIGVLVNIKKDSIILNENKTCVKLWGLIDIYKEIDQALDLYNYKNDFNLNYKLDFKLESLDEERCDCNTQNYAFECLVDNSNLGNLNSKCEHNKFNVLNNYNKS
jgi:hypothetical protein